MELVKLDVGDLFAFAFHCTALESEQPNSTYGFSRMEPGLGPKLKFGVSRVVNILWRADLGDLLATFQGWSTEPFERIAAMVHEKYPEARYKGIFTTGNYLLSPENGPLRVAGPPVPLENFEDGALIPHGADEKSARKGILGVVTGDGFKHIGILGPN